MNKFSIRLAELMRDNGVSQSQLATALNIKQQTVSRYINGDREPDIDRILEISKYFRVSTDYLLGLED